MAAQQFMPATNNRVVTAQPGDYRSLIIHQQDI